VRRVTGPSAALAFVCVFHAIAPLIWVGSNLSYEWDETVYISQVSLHAPAGLFTAPRARGLTILLAPLTELTSSTAALRWYLAVLSAVVLYLAFLPWLLLCPGYMAPIAAAFFSTLWTSIFYGFEAMPNLYVAIGAVASVGYFLRVCREPRRPVHLVWLALWLAFTALIRPSDSLYLVAALLAGAAAMRGVSLRRRGMVSAVLIGAVAVGWSEWIVEAFVSYGGLVRRLQAASAENTAGLHMALGLEARALAGPTLCRPCTQPVVWHNPLCGTALLAAGIRAREHPTRRRVWTGSSLPLTRWWWRTLWLTAVAAMLAARCQPAGDLIATSCWYRACSYEYISVAQAVREQGWAALRSGLLYRRPDRLQRGLHRCADDRSDRAARGGGPQVRCRRAHDPACGRRFLQRMAELPPASCTLAASVVPLRPPVNVKWRRGKAGGQPVTAASCLRSLP
jgi:hypothetical protein